MKKMKKMKGGVGYLAGSVAGSAIGGVADVIVEKIVDATTKMGTAIRGDIEKLIILRKDAAKEIIHEVRDATKDVISQNKYSIQPATTTPATTVVKGGKHKSRKIYKTYKNHKTRNRIRRIKRSLSKKH